jgi:DNA replicative helicase MCM subunit Mcm2 (Cdc46/Mcm family)
MFWHCSEVYIKAFSKVTPLTIRQVKASNIGQLVKISGIVTRCSDVKPLMQVAVYTCEECGFEIYQVLDLFSGFPFDYSPDMLNFYNKLF